jgi:hypothetical protein
MREYFEVDKYNTTRSLVNFVRGRSCIMSHTKEIETHSDTIAVNNDSYLERQDDMVLCGANKADYEKGRHSRVGILVGTKSAPSIARI